MAFVSSAPVGSFKKEFFALDLPFVFTDRAKLYSILDGEIGQSILDSLDSIKIKGLGFWENGFRQLSNNKLEVHKPEDIKGLKIRTIENEVHLAIWKALGANPAPLAFGELFTALQQGTFEAQETPINLFYDMKFYEVQKYLSLTGHTYEPAHVIANPKWFNGLDPKHQSIILKAAADAAVYQRQTLADKDKERFEVIKKAGVVIEENPDKAAFAKATEDLYKVLADTVPEKLVQKIRDQVAAVK